MIHPQHLQTWFSGQALDTRPQPFAIITAHNPHSESRTWSQNGRADELLWQQMNQCGHDPQRVVAGSVDWSHSEESWTVHGISLADALGVGRAFGQDAILWVQDGIVTIHDCESSAHEKVAAWDERCSRFHNPAQSHCVYVIGLDSAVWEKKRFAEANTDADPKKPLYYIGMTGLTPVERYARHKAGLQACPLVKNFGRGIVWDALAHLSRMSYDEAVAMEMHFATELRQEGHGVWQK